MGTVDRGLLWFDADRTPASELKFLDYRVWMLWVTAPTRHAKSTRHGFSKSGTGPSPRIPDEPRDLAYRGATT
jgi:hypothetical protein